MPVLMGALLVYNTAYCKKAITNRYDETNSIYYDNVYHNCRNINAALRVHGVNETDTVIILPDVAPNRVLYMCGNNGYHLTDAHYEANVLYLLQERGAQYVVCVNDEPVFGPFMQKVLGKPLLRQRDATVYKAQRTPFIRHLMDSTLDDCFTIPYRQMRTDRVWNEHNIRYAEYLHQPLLVVERMNGLKWFRMKEIDLNQRFEKYKQLHPGEETEQRKQFAGTLNQEEKYVWEKPTHTWFSGLEPLIH